MSAQAQPYSRGEGRRKKKPLAAEGAAPAQCRCRHPTEETGHMAQACGAS